MRFVSLVISAPAVAASDSVIGMTVAESSVEAYSQGLERQNLLVDMRMMWCISCIN